MVSRSGGSVHIQMRALARGRPNRLQAGTSSSNADAPGMAISGAFGPNLKQAEDVKQMAKEKVRVKRREKKNITSGVAHVSATFNNTMITITDAQGNAISWSSAGAQGFKGSRKSTPYAAQMAAEDAGKKAMEHGIDRKSVG